MAKKVTQLAHIAASTMLANGPFQMAMDSVTDFGDLSALGLHFSEVDVRGMVEAFGMDANVLTPTITPGSIPSPVQFLQNWLPGLVRMMTTARRIDALVGISIGGEWSDEEVVQQILELTGQPAPYSDLGNVPLASWNNSYERRSIVRFELGFEVGRLEEERTARIPNLATANEKRAAVGMAMEILRNRIGFYGYTETGRTFGFLNDPNLPAYNTVAQGARGSTEWRQKSFLEITADIRNAMASLKSQSGDNIDPERDSLVMALASDASQYLTVTSEYGNSVRQWLNENYPRLRIETAPELNAANGGLNVFYVYPETVNDGSSDGSRVFDQIVPTKLKTLGVEQRVKTYLEDFTNALGGVLLKRPWAVYRATGI